MYPVSYDRVETITDFGVQNVLWVSFEYHVFVFRSRSSNALALNPHAPGKAGDASHETQQLIRISVPRFSNMDISVVRGSLYPLHRRKIVQQMNVCCRAFAGWYLNLGAPILM